MNRGPMRGAYRDYVIRSFNADKPFDRFILEQMAGDEAFPGDRDALIATGFNLLGPDMTDSADQAQRRANTLNDMTDTAALAFLGLTMTCARCHDHKFEPIPQKDYFRAAGVLHAGRVPPRPADLHDRRGRRPARRRNASTWKRPELDPREDRRGGGASPQEALRGQAREALAGGAGRAPHSSGEARRRANRNSSPRPRRRFASPMRRSPRCSPRRSGRRWSELKRELKAFDAKKPARSLRWRWASPTAPDRRPRPTCSSAARSPVAAPRSNPATRPSSRQAASRWMR